MLTAADATVVAVDPTGKSNAEVSDLIDRLETEVVRASDAEGMRSWSLIADIATVAAVAHNGSSASSEPDLNPAALCLVRCQHAPPCGRTDKHAASLDSEAQSGLAG